MSPRAGPTSPSRGGGRVGNVDVLRAVAALGVLGIHAYALGGRNVPVKAVHVYDVPLGALASGVWLFFAISGYVITRPFVERLLDGRPLPDLGGYAVRRALRIFPLYWLALSAVIAIDGTAGTRGWQYPFHYLLLNNLIPGRQEALFPAAWTLTLEALFYIAVPLLALAVSRSAGRRVTPERLALLVVVSWLASIAFTVIADLQGDGQTGVWLRGSLPAMWQMFCPGIMLAIAPRLTRGRWRAAFAELPRRRGALAAAGLLLVAGAILGEAAPLRYGIVPYQLLVDASRPLYAIGYGLLVAAAIRAPAWGGRHRWAVELGLVSYGIYLLHPVIADLLVHDGLQPLAHDTLTAFVVNTACLAALTIPLALASWRWLEQPAIRLSRWLGGRARGPANTITGVESTEMRSFWNARAREDAFYFVDSRQPYKGTDRERFWEAEPLIDYLLGELGVRLEPTDTVLEIGCGVGRLTRVLAGRTETTIAVDVSDEMLARARELNPELANVRWTLGDGRTLAPIADRSVDACVSVVVLQHVPDPEITLGYVREVGRVLRPDGWAVLQVSNDPRIHRPRAGVAFRLKALVGRAPRGQHHPAWLGSHVELDAVRSAADGGGLELERVWGAGNQYCQLLLRKRRAG